MQYKVFTPGGYARKNLMGIFLFIAGAPLGAVMLALLFGGGSAQKATWLVLIFYTVLMVAFIILMTRYHSYLSVSPVAIIYTPAFAKENQVIFNKQDIGLITVEKTLTGIMPWVPGMRATNNIRMPVSCLSIQPKNGQKYLFEFGSGSTFKCLDDLAVNGYLSPEEAATLKIFILS